MRAFVEAIAYFKKNKKDSVQIILKKMRMNADQAKYAERTYDQYANIYFERVPYPSATGIKTVLESLVKENPKAKGAESKLLRGPKHSEVPGGQRLYKGFILLDRERRSITKY